MFDVERFVTNGYVMDQRSLPWLVGRLVCSVVCPQAESQINSLKLLKRQSYGRSGFDLMRRRVLMAA